MDVAGGLSLVQFVVEKLSSPIWTKIEGVLGLEYELDKLRETMCSIEAVLLDAEELEHLPKYRCSHVERNRLQRLKTALYRADDLVDEIVTLSNLKELMPCNNIRVCNEVCLFFSRHNQFLSASTWSKEMEKINEMLDDIVKDHRYDFVSRHPAGFDAKLMKINARETHSHVCEDDVIIGRDDDRRIVIDMLLNTTAEQQDGFVVSIVGIGGLGKTALARMVYIDEKIVEKFPRKLWICVSEDFSFKALVGRILTAANPTINQDRLQLQELQTELRKALDGKKCLLVLDDVWNDDPSEWNKLRNLLIGDGSRVSRILVTTRSDDVANVVGSRWRHKLKGLSDKESMDLFQKMALKPEECPMKPLLVDIGKDVIRKCANVPLAIRVIGSLLRSQYEGQWEDLKMNDLENIIQDASNGIVHVLKISYNYLPFYLKSCFSYCAVFPKGYKIIKEDLINLWMAQGFIIPPEGKSFEDAGEKYFKQLLQRCFFQDIELAEGEIVSCKMHDLIHDLAKEVAGTDILSCTYSARCFNEKTRHVSLDASTPEDLLGKLTNMQRIRTFLCIDQKLPFSIDSFVVEVSQLKYLRVLGLNNLRLKLFPSLVGELLHLRYIDLSGNPLDVLPSSITKLYNLQTLKLCDCGNLKGLPRELRKLINLRHLDISGCWSLRNMPPGMNNMTSLQKIKVSVVRKMDVAEGLSLVQSNLQLMDSAVQSVLYVMSHLQNLKKTMSTIDAIIRDAEELERLHHGCPSYKSDTLERLKEPLYQANDLLDEITTVAHLQKLMPGNKLSKEVSLFFSRNNQLRSALTWSNEIKSIRERLDDVVKDHQLAGGFRHLVVLEGSWVNPKETHPDVNLGNDVIIGRDDDKRVLIDMLLDDTTVQENVTVVTIVGIGGLGKTTLAQLVYNDDRIREEFPLKMWVRVSDDFNVKVLATQILAAATKHDYQNDGLTMNHLQEKLREVLDGNKYLLVLDDVWNENSEEWQKMKTLLVGGGRGSRVLVTSRSKKVAAVVGSCKTHELKGLSDDESLRLFEKMALKTEKHPMKPHLVDIGKEVVRKCANLPLAIRMVGRLLRGQGESKWENLTNIIHDEANNIAHVLKISYNYLPSHLKLCFGYCALFPKGYEIFKEDLIRLWMAQGFIMPSNGESFEDAGEEYFMQLLRRGFFQIVELDEGTTNEIVSCKMHDLIHDLAMEVAGTDILSCTYSPRCFNEKTRHVYLDTSTPEDLLGKLTNMQRIRTFLCTYRKLPLSIESLVVKEVSKMKYLRVLGLNYLGLELLPSQVGKLVHLRYLDLSGNDLDVLPSSITKLYNLQTLKLCHCRNLKRLPRELRKLVNLRHLDISGCLSLTRMPPGMNNMMTLNCCGIIQEEVPHLDDDSQLLLS